MTEARLLPAGELPQISRREARAAERERRGPIGTLFLMLREIILVVVVAVGLSLLVKVFLVQAFFIPSPSMESTLVRGDRVVVSKLTPGPFDLRLSGIPAFGQLWDVEVADGRARVEPQRA